MKITPESLRSIVFGVEDSLVSTVGLISGIAFVGVPKVTLLMTGTVLIFVEAFSMAVGSLLSDNSVRELEEKKSIPFAKSLSSALTMFLSYFFFGFVVLAPYLLFAGLYALYISISVSIAVLFILGIFSGRMSGVDFIKKGLSMALIGGAAIILGITVGSVVDLLGK